MEENWVSDWERQEERLDGEMGTSGIKKVNVEWEIEAAAAAAHESKTDEHLMHREVDELMSTAMNRYI